MYAQKGSKRSAEAVPEWTDGVVERRIVAEVSLKLRMSPRFSDDGRPEGTCERPLSIHLDNPTSAPAGAEEVLDVEIVPDAVDVEVLPEVEDEDEIDMTDEFVRAFHDPL